MRSYATSTDIKASLDMLDPAGTVTSVGGEGRILRGRDAIRNHAERHVASIRQQKITLGAMAITRFGETHALVVAPFDATITELPQIALATGAMTLLLAKRDAGWKVVHQHTSYSAVRDP